jgi:penicillin-binding protein 2
MQQEADRARSFTRRALFVGGAQVAFFGALVGRLYHLQVQRSAEYGLLAEDNRVNQRLLIPARGHILDRNGIALARNVPTYRVRIIREQAGDLRATLQRLGQLISLPPEQIESVAAAARAHRAFVPMTVREDLSWDEVSRIAVHSPDLPGVVLDSGLLREYPYGDVLSHVLGYVGPVSQAEQQRDPDPLLQLPDFRIGKSGIERTYDKMLRGRSGLSRVEVNAIGREIKELDRTEGEPGADIQLSLDLDLQRFCFARLTSELAASAVVIDVRTGGILALASVPSYDPASFTGGLSRSLWTELRDNPRHPLVNKCIRGQYPPGSTFKMITALAGLEAGAITQSSKIFCPGSVSLGSARFYCWKDHGHGSVNLLNALEQSCDCYFYEVARRVGVDAIAEMANRFGLGHRLDLDLPGEQPGLIPTRAWKKAALKQSWQKGETLICGIGQGYVSTTPLQLAVMTARLANGGLAVKPHFVQPADAPPPAPLGVSKASLDLVLHAMREVVHGPRGTARKANLGLPGIEMGGKTGTAQVRRISKTDRASGRHKREDIPWEERDHALFVCFAPYHEPRYAVSVIVEHGLHGSTAAAPIARDIMRKTLELNGVAAEPQTATAERGNAI